MLPLEVEPAPESVMVPSSATTAGVAASTAVGGPWMVTSAKAAALFWPRLSVTTSENFTDPDTLGTVTSTLEVGAVVVVLGLLGDSETTVVAIGFLHNWTVLQLGGCSRVHWY
jgi:hypothetical protein